VVISIHSLKAILVTIALFVLISSEAMAQSKWDHGFSVGLAYTNFSEDHVSSIDSERYTFEALLNSSFKIWNQYSLSRRLGINFSPGFSWKGARLNAELSNYEGIYFVLPSYLEFQLLDQIAIGAGVEYSYLISFGESSNDEIYNLTSQVSNRHQFSSLTNLRFIIGHNISINLEYSYGLNDLFQFSRFNTMGGFREMINLRNKGIQLAFIFQA